MERELYRRTDPVDMDRLRKSIIISRLDTTVKCEFLEYLEAEKEEAVGKLQCLVYDFFHADVALEKARSYKDIRAWAQSVVDGLKPDVEGYTNQQIHLLLALIVNEQALRDGRYEDVFSRFTEMYRREGRVL